MKKMLFDDWAARYDAWFETPACQAVRRYEAELVKELLQPRAGETLLDAGCGTGVFTQDFLAAGAAVTGLDISAPMLDVARKKTGGLPFFGVRGDMLHLPFLDGSFDKAVSVTALEFIGDARRAVDELFRVTRRGGRVVVATLNSLSSWADRRRSTPPDDEQDVWQNAIFRPPDGLLALSPYSGVVRTAIHFEQDADPDRIDAIEERGKLRGLMTGAFVAARWEKPA